MKKTLVCILALVIGVSIIISACAEVDLSGMSFAELIELQQEVNKALWSSNEWKEVEIPLGIWDIGKDIPAGRYEVTPGPNGNAYNSPYFIYYLERHENGTPDKIRADYRIHQGEKLVIELFEGNVIKIEDVSVIFKPYVPNFNF